MAVTGKNFSIIYCPTIIAWFRKQPFNTKFIFSFFFAGITGIFAQIRFYLPWTPIPITLQTISVIYTGLTLGSWFAGLSQLVYILLGLLGIPWFSGLRSGMVVLMGPSGGYLLGFVFASFFVGWIIERIEKNGKSYFTIFQSILIANFILIYGCGLIQLALFYYKNEGLLLTFTSLLTIGVLPFIIGDILKIGLIIGFYFFLHKPLLKISS